MRKINYMMLPVALIMLEMSMAGCMEAGDNRDTRTYRDGMERQQDMNTGDGMSQGGAGSGSDRIDNSDTMGNSNEQRNSHIVD